MRCPFCGYPDSRVINSRPTDEGISIRRRRECMNCGKRFTTYETVETRPLVVVKKDGERQAFDRQKILRGMLRACEKRTVSLDQLERIAAQIEQDLQNSMEREIPTDQIGEKVMEYLRTADQVAYVRFASVYRQFQDIDTFADELNKLRDRKAAAPPGSSGNGESSSQAVQDEKTSLDIPRNTEQSAHSDITKAEQSAYSDTAKSALPANAETSPATQTVVMSGQMNAVTKPVSPGGQM